MSFKIGKFDSAESLLKSYEELEKEFTKRCQRLKELEKDNERLSQNLTDKEYLTEAAKKMLADEEFKGAIASQESVKNRVLEEYLSSLNNGVRVMGSANGCPTVTPPASARTLTEAKAIADRILNG